MKLSSRKAFTLIELIAAFAVFALIILAVGAMVQQSSDSWRDGLDSANVADEGRAFTDEIFRDLTAMVCSTNFPVIVENSRLYIVTGYRRKDNGTSDLSEVAYFLKADPSNSGRSMLMRRQKNVMTGSMRKQFAKGGALDSVSKIMGQPFWGGSADEFNAIIAKNVRAFRIACYDEKDNKYPSGFNSIAAYQSNGAIPPVPARIEVTLEILPEDTWRRKEAGGASSGLEAATVETFSVAVSPLIGVR